MILFCFTYAGGTATFYNQVEKKLSDKIDVVKLEYPGHGSRRSEKFCESFVALAADAVDTIMKRLSCEEEFALFGYSMGSIVAAIALRQMIDRKLTLPKRVFLAAHEPKTKNELAGFSEQEADEWIKKRVLSFNDVPKQLENNPVFWRMYFPMYKADFGLIGTFDFNTLRFTTKIPATVFYSESDTPLTDMVKWRSYFVGECDFREYFGNHFFIREHLEEMMAVVTQELGL